MVIFSDFDGTISQQDSLKSLLDEFGGPSWSETQAQMLSGKLTEREALSHCFDDMLISPQEAMEWVDQNVDLDPRFSEFVDWCRKNSFPLVVLSGGFTNFIERIFQRDGVEGLPVYANRLDLQANDWSFEEKKGPRLCQVYSHCKCSSFMKSSAWPSVYIGDGLTDACVAKRSELVFAKSWLSAELQKNSRSFYEFENFADVQAQLEEWISRPAAAQPKLAMSKVPLDRVKI